MRSILSMIDQSECGMKNRTCTARWITGTAGSRWSCKRSRGSLGGNAWPPDKTGVIRRARTLANSELPRFRHEQTINLLSSASRAVRAGTSGTSRRYLPFHWDAAKGRVLFEIPKLNEDLLYFAGVGQGVGSVELGVSRGASYASTVIYFDRVGPRVRLFSAT